MFDAVMTRTQGLTFHRVALYTSACNT